MMLAKSKPLRSKKLRDSACSEDCTLRIPGVCNFDTETTVLAHLPFMQSGMGMKTPDFCACFACSACHDVIDYRVKAPSWCDALAITSLMSVAMVKTWQRWIERGLIKVEGAK